jgi:hypothetical protein
VGTAEARALNVTAARLAVCDASKALETATLGVEAGRAIGEDSAHALSAAIGIRIA